ncbi:Gfo/Idh/MocA family oxidoreductase [Limisphaera ngatamarikiensis]|jgi:predicted dehydrogenase|uniref:Gfo/Idh/MocA family oxidoreductase n=1 Tax=Limisphaera ngatamarikiensis TaxID=1324935 RepID=A0A6M1RP80_9BACT|nr:Gfo/Idh/MocA family oxidoreductase [Limisphaera ngatamarikiensis]NGO39473.1 Gfo/Idh/MocA family oxidoreductase [Limisphaera ngatamarikiensis]
MKTSMTRRAFLRRAAWAAGGLTAAATFRGPNLLLAQGAGRKLNCAVIGCGGRGMSHLNAIAAENIVAVADVDERRFAEVTRWLKSKNLDPDKVRFFTDYRRLFDEVGRSLDAVFVATPNHQHALPAMIAMQLGKAVYVEKPVCHNIGEARALREMARRTRVATQMGNQGHNEEGYRRLCEYIWAGVIGPIRETHSWTNRCNGGEGPRPPAKPVPPGLHWDEWIGPAPYRDFHDDLHPHSWHGWYDFGNGSIGNMGCHVLDGVFWALKIEHPTSIEVEYLRGGSDERYPLGSRIRWDIPARGDLPPLKVYWYEGLNPTTNERPQGALRAAVGDARNLPPLLLELRRQYPEEELDRGDSGTLYVGEKGIIFTGTYGERMHVVPWARMREIPEPPRTLPRPKNIFADFLEAVREGRTDTAASFEYGTRLTEFCALGNLAQMAGPGRKVEWDGPNMRVTNIPELNARVQRENRPGWRI